MDRELKTVVTVIGRLPEAHAQPCVPAGLVVEPGITPEMVTVVHPRTRRRSQLFLFELDLAQLLFDGASGMPEMVARMQQLGHSVTFDQLAAWIQELARLGCADHSLGIEPSRRTASLPWRQRPEPPVVTAQWPTDARQIFNRALTLFREGQLPSAATLLQPVLEHPVAGPAARRLLQIILEATGVALAGVPVAAAPPPAKPAPLPFAEQPDAPDDDGFGDDEGDWVAEATQVLARDDLLAAQQLIPEPEPILSPAAMAALKRWTRVGVMLGSAIVAALLVPVPYSLRYPCVVEPSAVTSVRAALPVKLEEVLVDEAQRVEQGEVVARQSTAEQRAKVQRLEAEVERARAELRLLQEGNREEQLAQLRTRAGALARALGVAQSRVQALSADVEAGRAPRADLEAARAKAVQLIAETRAARAELKLAEAGARSEDVEKAAAELSALEAELAFQRLVLDAANLKAERSGRVLTRDPRLLAGQHFNPGDPILEIAALDEMRVKVFVSERDFDLLEVGMSADLRLAAQPDRELSFEVLRVAPEVAVREEERVIVVEGRVPNGDGALAPGMSGYAELHVGWRPVIVLVGRGVVRWLRVNMVL